MTVAAPGAADADHPEIRYRPPVSSKLVLGIASHYSEYISGCHESIGVLLDGLKDLGTQPDLDFLGVSLSQCIAVCEIISFLMPPVPSGSPVSNGDILTTCDALRKAEAALSTTEPSDLEGSLKHVDELLSSQSDVVSRAIGLLESLAIASDEGGYYPAPADLASLSALGHFIASSIQKKCLQQCAASPSAFFASTSMSILPPMVTMSHLLLASESFFARSKDLVETRSLAQIMATAGLFKTAAVEGMNASIAFCIELAKMKAMGIGQFFRNQSFSLFLTTSEKLRYEQCMKELSHSIKTITLLVQETMGVIAENSIVGLTNTPPPSFTPPEILLSAVNYWKVIPSDTKARQLPARGSSLIGVLPSDLNKPLPALSIKRLSLEPRGSEGSSFGQVRPRKQLPAPPGAGPLPRRERGLRRTRSMEFLVAMAPSIVEERPTSTEPQSADHDDFETKKTINLQRRDSVDSVLNGVGLTMQSMSPNLVRWRAEVAKSLAQRPDSDKHQDMRPELASFRLVVRSLVRAIGHIFVIFDGGSDIVDAEDIEALQHLVARLRSAISTSFRSLNVEDSHITAVDEKIVALELKTKNLGECVESVPHHMVSPEESETGMKHCFETLALLRELSSVVEEIWLAALDHPGSETASVLVPFRNSFQSEHSSNTSGLPSSTIPSSLARPDLSMLSLRLPEELVPFVVENEDVDDYSVVYSSGSVPSGGVAWPNVGTSHTTDGVIVKYATLSKLVDRLTHWRIQDPMFSHIFLQTMSTFVIPRELFSLLSARATSDPPGNVPTDLHELYKKHVSSPIRTSIAEFVCRWIPTNPVAFRDRQLFADVEALSGTLRKLASDSGDGKETAAAAKLAETLSNISARQPRSRTWSEEVAPWSATMDDVTLPITPPYSPATPNSVTSPVRSSPLSIMQIEPLNIARQMALIDLALYRAIKPVEILDQAYNKPGSRRVIAPNVTGMIERFNFVVGLVTTTIMGCATPKQRADVIQHFIVTAKRSADMRSLNAAHAITAALTSASVYRLKRSWEKVPRRITTLLKDLTDLFSPLSNWQALRSLLGSLSPHFPTVPWLGLYLRDIIVIEDAQGLMAETVHGADTGPMVNFVRARMLSRVLDEILRFQNAEMYTYPVDERVQGLLTEDKGLLRSPSRQFAVSLVIEPK